MLILASRRLWPGAIPTAHAGPSAPYSRYSTLNGEPGTTCLRGQRSPLATASQNAVGSLLATRHARSSCRWGGNWWWGGSWRWRRRRGLAGPLQARTAAEPVPARHQPLAGAAVRAAGIDEASARKDPGERERMRGLAPAHPHGQLERRDQQQVEAEWPQLLAGAELLLDLRPPAAVLDPGRLGPGVQEPLAVRFGLLTALGDRRERGLVVGVGLGQLVAQWRLCPPGQDVQAGQRPLHDALVRPGERHRQIGRQRPMGGVGDGQPRRRGDGGHDALAERQAGAPVDPDLLTLLETLARPRGVGDQRSDPQHGQVHPGRVTLRVDAAVVAVEPLPGPLQQRRRRRRHPLWPG